MANTKKPTTAQLLDWLEGRLAAADSDAVARAVESDPTLQAEVGWLRDFLETSSTTILVDPPADVHQVASAAFAAYARNKRPARLLQTIVATLTADNWQRLSLAGVRNVTLRDTPRQLVYSSSLADVALNVHVKPSTQNIDIDGQIFPLDENASADFVVQLLQDGVERRLTTSDAFGRFSMTSLPGGSYVLYLSGDEADIEIGPIDFA